jgi:prepilin-type N-terminal cleavage/methylation domain-containing protein
MFHRSKTKSKLRLNTKGFSLIEILIAVGILALITVPLAMNMISSSQLNSKAKQTAAASDLTTAIIEVLQAVDLSDILIDVNGYDTNEYGAKLDYTLIGSEEIPGALKQYNVGSAAEVVLDQNGNFVPVSKPDDLEQLIPSSIVVKKTEHDVNKVYFVGQKIDHDLDNITGEYAFLLTDVSTEELSVDVLVTMTPKQSFSIVDITSMNQSEVYCVQQLPTMDANSAAKFYRMYVENMRDEAGFDSAKDTAYFLANMTRTIEINIDKAKDVFNISVNAVYKMDDDGLMAGEKTIIEPIGKFSTNSTAEFAKGVYLYYYPLWDGPNGSRDAVVINNTMEVGVPIYLVALSDSATVDYTDEDQYGVSIHYHPSLKINEYAALNAEKTKTNICSNIPDKIWDKTFSGTDGLLTVKSLGNVSEQQTMFEVTVRVYRHRDASYDSDGIFTPRSKDLLISTDGSFIDTSERADLEDAENSGAMPEPGIATAWKYPDLIFDGTEKLGVDGQNVVWSGTTVATNAGTYSATAKPMPNCTWGNGSTSPRTFVWTIAKDNSASVVMVSPSPTYNGLIQEGVIGVNVIIEAGITQARDAGFYTVQARPMDNYAWSDGTSGSRTFTWKIAPKVVTVQWGTDRWLYDGETHFGECFVSPDDLCGSDVCIVTVENNAIKDIGSIEARAIGLSNKNYAMSHENTVRTLTVVTSNEAFYTIKNGGSLAYNGELQSIIGSSAGIYVSGDASAMSVGTYSFTVNVMPGYTWLDGTTDPKTETWTITPRPAVLAWGQLQWEYDGQYHSTTCTVSNAIPGDIVRVTLENNAIKDVSNGTRHIVRAVSIDNPNYVLAENTEQYMEIIRSRSATYESYSFEYDTKPHIGVIGTHAIVTGDYKATNVKLDANGMVIGYTCTVTPTDNYAWAPEFADYPGDYSPKTVTWYISPIKDAWYSGYTEAIYMWGDDICPIFRQFNVTMTGNVYESEILAEGADDYVIALQPIENHAWKDTGTNEVRYHYWRIIRWEVTLPELEESLYEYTGDVIEPQFNIYSFDGGAYRLSGDTSARNVRYGDDYYVITVTLEDETAVWKDTQTSEPRYIYWQIAPTIADLEYTRSDNEWTYDNSAKTGTIKITNLTPGDSATLTYSNNVHTDVGEYNFVVTGISNPNYILPPNEADRTFKMYINKKQLGIDWGTDTNRTFTYDGNAKTVTPTFTGLASGDSQPSYTIINNSYTNAGTYYPEITAIGDPNYSLPSESQLKTTMWINKCELTITWGTSEWVFDNASHIVTATPSGAGPLNVTFVYDHSTSISNVGTKNRTITGLSGDGANNYKLPSSGLSATTKITAKPLTLNWGTVSWTYDGAVHQKTTSNVSWGVLQPPISGVDPGLTISCPSAVNVGTYTATASITNTNYTLTNPTQELTITKKAGFCAAPSKKTGLTYNGYWQTLITAPTGSCSGTVEYAWSSSGDWYTDIDEMCAKDAGMYTIYYRAAESANYYASAPQALTISITKATLTIYTTPDKHTNLTYNGNLQHLLSTAPTIPNGTTAYFSINGAEFGTGAPAARDAGDYTISWYIDGGTNYYNTQEESLGTVTIKKALADHRVSQDLVWKSNLNGYLVTINSDRIVEDIQIFDDMYGYTGDYYYTYDPGNNNWVYDVNTGYPYDIVRLTLVSSNYQEPSPSFGSIVLYFVCDDGTIP